MEKIEKNLIMVIINNVQTNNIPTVYNNEDKHDKKNVNGNK